MIIFKSLLERIARGEFQYPVHKNQQNKKSDKNKKKEKKKEEIEEKEEKKEEGPVDFSYLLGGGDNSNFKSEKGGISSTKK